MGKVRLTTEQAEAIERIKKDTHGGITNGNINTQISKRWRRSPYDSLNDLSLKKFLDALYIGYEVDPEYSVGDWIHDNITNRVAEIDERGYDGELAWVDDEFHNFFTDFRHATPEEIAEEKERRWWAKHSRDVWELRKGDLLKSKDEGYISEIEKTHQNGDPLFKGGVTSMNLSTAKEIYEMTCFVEDRKDV